jgi:hypothetical protein
MDPRIRIRENIYVEDHSWDEEEIWSTQANADRGNCFYDFIWSTQVNADRRNCFYDFREQEISQKNLKIAKITKI